MRIISQDGVADYNYDLVNIYAAGTRIKAWVPGLQQNELLAEYSSPEKAMKAMDRLHTVYKSVKGMKSGDALNYVEFPKVWRFPADSEV